MTAGKFMQLCELALNLIEGVFIFTEMGLDVLV